MEDKLQRQEVIQLRPVVGATNPKDGESVPNRRIGNIPYHQGKVIVMTSPKGGVGKTTLSCNLASLLSGKVVIVDLMHPHGNVATRLHTHTHINILSWQPYLCDERQIQGEIMEEQLTIRHPLYPLHVIPAVPLGEECTPELIRYVLAQLQKWFDYIVVDIGPERYDLLSVAMQDAEHTYLIIDHDLATIVDTAEYVRRWQQDRISLDRLRLVMNFEPEKGRKETAYSEVAYYLRGIPVVASFPEIVGMRRVHSQGKLMVYEERTHPFTKAMERFVSIMVPAPIVGEKPGLFRRLFGRGKK